MLIKTIQSTRHSGALKYSIRKAEEVEHNVIDLFKATIKGVRSGKRCVIHNFMTSIGFDLTFNKNAAGNTRHTRFFRNKKPVNNTIHDRDHSRAATITPGLSEGSGQNQYGKTGMTFASTNSDDLEFIGSNLSSSFIEYIQRGNITLIPDNLTEDNIINTIKTALEIANAWKQTHSTPYLQLVNLYESIMPQRQPRSVSIESPVESTQEERIKLNSHFQSLFKYMLGSIGKGSGRRQLIHDFMSHVGFKLTGQGEPITFQLTNTVGWGGHANSVDFPMHLIVSFKGRDKLGRKENYGLSEDKMFLAMKKSYIENEEQSGSLFKGNLSSCFIDNINREGTSLTLLDERLDSDDQKIEVLKNIIEVCTAWNINLNNSHYQELKKRLDKLKEKKFYTEKEKINFEIKQKIKGLEQFNKKLSSYTGGKLQLNIEELTSEQTAISLLEPGRNYTNALKELNSRKTNLLATIEQVLKDCQPRPLHRSKVSLWETTLFYPVVKLAMLLAPRESVKYRVPLNKLHWTDRLALFNEFGVLQQDIVKLNRECVTLSNNCIALDIPNFQAYQSAVMTGTQSSLMHLKEELVELKKRLCHANTSVRTHGCFYNAVTPVLQYLNKSTEPTKISIGNLVKLSQQEWSERLNLLKSFHDLQRRYIKLNNIILDMSNNSISLDIPGFQQNINHIITGEENIFNEMKRVLTELQGQLLSLNTSVNSGGLFYNSIFPVRNFLIGTSEQIKISVEQLLTQNGVDSTKSKALHAVWQNMIGGVSSLNKKIFDYNNRYSVILKRIENRFNLKIYSLIEGSGVLEAITFDQSATDETKIRRYKLAQEKLEKNKQLLEHIEKWLSLSTHNPQGWLDIVTKYPTEYPRLSTNFLSALEKIKTYTSKVQGYIDSKKKSSRSHFMSHKQKETKINAALKLLTLTTSGKAEFKPSELSALNEGKLHSLKEMLSEGVKREIVIQQLKEYLKTRKSEGEYHYFFCLFQNKSCSRGMKVKAAELLLLFTQFQKNPTKKALLKLKEFMIENKQYEVEIQKALQGGRLKNIKECLLRLEEISTPLLTKILGSCLPIKISALTQEGSGQQKRLLQLISNDNRWKDIEDPKINSNRGPGI